jgi:hemerythrin-like metal-binding protein
MLAWNEGYTLGMSITDSENKKLVAIAEQLNESVAHGDNARTQKGLLTNFISTLITHFEREEGLMHHYQCPDTEDHVDEHRAFAAQMTKMNAGFEAGAITLPLESLQTLRNWFDRHIRKYDQMLVRHIKTNDTIGLRA